MSGLAEDQYVSFCKMCGRKIKNLPHDYSSSFCNPCRGKHFEKNEEKQMSALLEISENLKELVHIMKEASK